MHLFKQNNFMPRFESHVFLGYPKEYEGYICFNPSNEKIVISKDVVWLEENFDQNLGLSVHPSDFPGQHEAQAKVSNSVLTKINLDENSVHSSPWDTEMSAQDQDQTNDSLTLVNSPTDS